MAIRVLHVVESLAPEAGSVAISLPGLFNALRVKGIESQTVALDPPRRTDFQTAPGKPAAQRRGGTALSSGTRQLVEQMDVVHFHGWGYELARKLAGVSKTADKPYVISPHGSLSTGTYNRRSWRDRFRSWLGERLLVRRASAVTALNEQEERDLRAHRVNSDISQLPYGVDASGYEEIFEARHCPTLCSVKDGELSTAQASSPGLAEGRSVLMLGPIHPVEGFVALLKTLSELGPTANGWNVVMAGRETGKWRKMLEAAIRRKGGQDRVLFTPAPDVVTQRAWLARASFLAAPSLHIRFPVSIMQAIAAGVPVLASACTLPPGLEDVVQVCGPTRHELKTALRSLLGLSDEERAATAQRAHSVWRSRYDWSVLVDEYVRLYQRLISAVRSAK